ncbi:MAG: Stealth CR1 domain-containing protein [Bacilli bacterium]|nr:Stealth CR1 domain-containing protein [Bacilli bacterium]
MKDKIDFVVTWVDGNDQNWINEKNHYLPKEKMAAIDNRFKDWGLFKYWFRGVEKFAPWVNKIYFITWGHVPTWLDTSNPKLVIVNHKDYIPKEYLPTYNSNVLELNLHRIKELSENFVLFNDDTIIIKKTKPTDFFKDNKPKDTVALNVHCPQKSRIIQSICNNNVSIINEHFNFKKSFKENLGIWFNPKNGKQIVRTLALMNCPRFPGFYQTHLPASHKKSIFKKVWELEPEIMNLTSSHKFRESTEVNHWMMKAWYIADGNVVNRKDNFGKTFHVTSEKFKNELDSIINYIIKQKGKIVCINDNENTDEQFEEGIKKIIESLDKIMPEKSSFEK